jgi:hypothetical protein
VEAAGLEREGLAFRLVGGDFDRRGGIDQGPLEECLAWSDGRRRHADDAIVVIGVVLARLVEPVRSADYGDQQERRNGRNTHEAPQVGTPQQRAKRMYHKSILRNRPIRRARIRGRVPTALGRNYALMKRPPEDHQLPVDV